MASLLGAEVDTLLVSIVMPTYNRASLVGQAIESVLGQDYPHWELLVVDDGSTDDTGRVLSEYRGDCRIRCFHQSNSGQATARNVGVRNARGQFVAFLDSDNRWLPHKLSTQTAYLKANPAVDVLYGDGECIDLAGRVLPVKPSMKRYSGQVWRQLLIDNFVAFNTAIVRVEKLTEIGGFDEQVRRGDDYDLWLRMSVGSMFHYLPGIVTQYRVEGERISTNVEGRYESNLATINRFLVAHPGLLNDLEVREARARVHARFARSLATRGQMRAALRAARTAVGLTPGQYRVWRTLAAVALQPVRSRLGENGDIS